MMYYRLSYLNSGLVRTMSKARTIRKADLLAHCGNSQARVARLFRPPISRSAVCQWGEELPPGRVHDLIEEHPELKTLLVQPIKASADK